MLLVHGCSFFLAVSKGRAFREQPHSSRLGKAALGLKGVISHFASTLPHKRNRTLDDVFSLLPAR